jgi:hypothetical protein
MLVYALLQEIHVQPNSDGILQLPASSRDVPHFALRWCLAAVL